MKSNKWLGKVVEKKLLKIKCEAEDKFGKSEYGRGHWNETEFMMKHSPIYFPSKFKNVTSSKRPMITLTHVNSNLNLEMFPVYVLQYVRHDDDKSVLIKTDGIFTNVNPCVLILKDGHYYNVWDYNSLFNEISWNIIHGGRKRNKGSSERYEKRFCLRWTVSYSLEILHVRLPG